MLLLVDEPLKAPVIWLPLLLEVLLALSFSLLLLVSVWLTLAETITAVLVSVEELLKSPVIWLPLLLELLLSVSSSVLASVSV